MIPGTIAYVAPTQTFSDELEVEISGVKMKMVFVAGESSDQIYVWLPEKEVLLIGDNIYAIVSNVYTLRGAVYRDPMNYVNALDKMIPLEAEYLVASHVIPVTGKENVRDVLVSTRDATQYLYDQTIRGMNAGYTADELSRMIELPENLDNHPWLTKARNDVSAHVKQIYYGNFGWFEGNSAFLNAVSLEERSHKIVDGFGGVKSSISSLQVAIDNEEYEWAAELGTYILNVEPDNEEAKLLTAYVLRVLSYSSEGMDERNWLLTDALELEGKITIDPKSFSQSSPEQMAELPIDKIIRFLPTKLDPQKAAGMNTVLGVSYSDIETDFTLHVRNSILAVADGAPNNPDMTLTLDSDTHKLIVGGHLNVLDAIQSGQAELSGDIDDLVAFLNLFDNVSVSTNGIG
jgi:alkyl sulfatase BDS1-like metallo-beta-lactamase superfamily hydrolase